MTAKPGWYPDPEATTFVEGSGPPLRWWDGQAWAAAGQPPTTIPTDPDLPSWYSALRWTLVAVMALISAVSIASIASNLWTIRTVQKWKDDPATVTQSAGAIIARLGIALAVASLVLFLLASVLTVVWSYTGYRSSRQGDRKHKTQWMIWGWFVPLVNWIMPPLLINDFAKGAAREASTRSGRAQRAVWPAMVWVWWTTFAVVGRMLSRWSMWVERKEETQFQAMTDQLIEVSKLDAVVAGLDFVAAILMIWIVLRITNHLLTPATQSEPR